MIFLFYIKFQKIKIFKNLKLNEKFLKKYLKNSRFLYKIPTIFSECSTSPDEFPWISVVIFVSGKDKFQKMIVFRSVLKPRKFQKLQNVISRNFIDFNKDVLKLKPIQNQENQEIFVSEFQDFINSKTPYLSL